ncbi:hypothetical protein [Nocardia sp. MW-W600-9]
MRRVAPALRSTARGVTAGLIAEQLVGAALPGYGTGLWTARGTRIPGELARTRTRRHRTSLRTHTRVEIGTSLPRNRSRSRRVRRRGPLLRELARARSGPLRPEVVGAPTRPTWTLLGREFTRTITGHGTLRAQLLGDLVGAGRRTRRQAGPWLGEIVGAGRRIRRLAGALLPGQFTRLPTGTGYGTWRLAWPLLRELARARSGSRWPELVGASAGSGVARTWLRRETTGAGQRALPPEFVGTGVRRRELTRATRARRLTGTLLPGELTRLLTRRRTRRLPWALVQRVTGLTGGRTWRLARPLLLRELTRLTGGRMRRLARPLLQRELTRLTGGRTWRLTGTLLLRELPRATGRRHRTLRRNTWTIALAGTLLRKLTGLPRQLHTRNVGVLRTVVPIAVRRARRIRRTIAGPIGGNRPIPRGRLIGGPVTGLPLARLTPTLLVEPRLGGPIRPTFRRSRTRRGDVPLVFPARHATLPWRDRGRACRSVAAIVVVVPMSGIIVAHHASCTRRNPRIPPVR